MAKPKDRKSKQNQVSLHEAILAVHEETMHA